MHKVATKILTLNEVAHNTLTKFVSKKRVTNCIICRIELSYLVMYIVMKLGRGVKSFNTMLEVVTEI